jgi:hypothetical protein
MTRSGGTTKLLANNAMSGGAVLRIVPGQTAQVFLGQSGCTGCHAVSANGSRMVADPLMSSTNGSGATYALTPTVSVNPTPLVANAPNATFAGVYPDGSLYVGNAHPNNGFGGPRPGGPLGFAVGSATDYSGSGVGLGALGGMSAVGLSTAPTSDLYVLDAVSNSAVVLGQAVGFATAADAASNTTYLPFGASDELHHNYYPTVSPVAAGGYFWVFFDSYRHYGSLGLVRQLWGTAVDVRSDGQNYKTDPSHPAFFVTGQEIGTGNHRAFTALDPCHADGASCTTGVDCCGGYCTNRTCGLPVPRCSNIDETCGPGHSCCDPSAQCINGFCEKPTIQ